MDILSWYAGRDSFTSAPFGSGSRCCPRPAGDKQSSPGALLLIFRVLSAFVHKTKERTSEMDILSWYAGRDSNP